MRELAAVRYSEDDLRRGAYTRERKTIDANSHTWSLSFALRARRFLPPRLRQ